MTEEQPIETPEEEQPVKPVTDEKTEPIKTTATDLSSVMVLSMRDGRVL